MVLRSGLRSRALTGTVLAAAALTLAACGSSSAPSSPSSSAAATTAAATTAAPTTVAATTTTVRVDPNLAVITAMTDCDSLTGVLKSSQVDLDAAKDDYYKKLYGDRVAAAKAKAAELKCPTA